MAVPKKRTTRSKRGKRRSHHAHSPLNLIRCPKCKTYTLSHQMCPACGIYAGRIVVDVQAKLSKKEQQKKAKEEEQKKQEVEAQTKEQKKEASVRPGQDLSLENLSKKT